MSKNKSVLKVSTKETTRYRTQNGGKESCIFSASKTEGIPRYLVRNVWTFRLISKRTSGGFFPEQDTQYEVLFLHPSYHHCEKSLTLGG